MDLKKNRLKLYYSIGEVARMFHVNESLLRYWEKQFPEIKPKKAGRGIRQYRAEDVEIIKQIYHLVKEKGMTLPGARAKLRAGGEGVKTNIEIIERLEKIKEELLSMRQALDGFTYEQVDKLKEDIVTSLEAEGE